MAREACPGSPVERDLPVSLQAQIAAALESEIRDGRRRSDEALPAARALAGRLGVHRHTVAAAYRRLEERGLVRTSPGRPPVVRAPRDRPEETEMGPAPPHSESIGAALRAARRAGLPRRAALRALRDALDVAGGRRVTLYEPRPGLRVALAAELSEVLGPRLRAVRAAAPRCEPRAGAALLRAELWPRLAARLPEVERIPIRLTGGGAERERILRGLPRPGVVALLTRSWKVRTFARELAAGAYGRGVSLATPDPADRAALERAARVAALFLADASCVAFVPPTRAVVRRLRLVAEADRAELRRYFGEP